MDEECRKCAFLVEISVDVPYPKKFEFREETSSVAAAIGRAIRKARKELPRKRIDTYRIKATKM